MSAKILLGLAFSALFAASLLVGACSSGSGGGASTDTDAGAGAMACPELAFPGTCPSPPPSWKNDVRPLVQRYCDQCHGNGSTAATQLNLTTYADVATNRTRCWTQIEQCTMPNANGSPPPMAYPTPDERQTMVTWMDVCGAPNN